MSSSHYSPEHEHYPVDNIKGSKKYREENKEKQIHSCRADFILQILPFYHFNFCPHYLQVLVDLTRFLLPLLLRLVYIRYHQFLSWKSDILPFGHGLPTYKLREVQLPVPVDVPQLEHGLDLHKHFALPEKHCQSVA